jgi:proteasome beta subunit
MNEELKNSILKTGTSIIGIVCKDGVVLAADRQVTVGNTVAQKNMRKAAKVNNYLVGAVAGNASDAQMLMRMAAAELRLKHLKSKKRPTVKESASLISMMSYKNIRQLSTIPSIVGSLIAGYNEDGTFELYTIEPAGSIYRVEDYDANFGSGMPYMLGLLEKNYNKELTVKQGVDLAFDALKSSTQRDIGSGYGIDIFTITNQGVKKVIEQEIKPDYKESQKKSA